MQGISQTLRRLIRIFDEQSIPYMLIGGFALPAYGRIRATQHIDTAIAADFSQSVRLQKRLRDAGFQLPSPPQEPAPVFLVGDLGNMVEIEIWTKPDGVVFDRELLRRRVIAKPWPEDPQLEVFLIGPEDFIANKLARKDRGVQDEQDVASVLKRREHSLDYKYLRKRAKSADVLELLETLIERVKKVGR